MKAIKLCKKKVSPSEVNKIAAVVISIADNIERVFSGIAYTRRGVTESVTEMRERVNTIYSEAK